MAKYISLHNAGATIKKKEVEQQKHDGFLQRIKPQ